MLMKDIGFLNSNRNLVDGQVISRIKLKNILEKIPKKSMLRVGCSTGVIVVMDKEYNNLGHIDFGDEKYYGMLGGS